MTNAIASSETTTTTQRFARGFRAAAFMVMLALLVVSVGCSRSGGSRFNGGNNTTVATPPPVTTPPTISNFVVSGAVDPVTLQVTTTTGPFSAPVRFSYLLNDAEDSELELLVEYSRASAPTTFLPATLIGNSNPVTGLLAANYEDPASTANTFVWDAQTDLNPGINGLTETVQFRITVTEPGTGSATQAIGGGVSFNFPLPANVTPVSTTFAPAATGNLSGNVTLNYEVSDTDLDNLTIQMFYTGPIVAGQATPPAQPMTLIQVNSSPTTPVAGQAVDPLNPNTFTVASANYSGTVVWDSLNDLGVTAFGTYIFTLQVSDGTGSAPALQTGQLTVGNPTAAFAQSFGVIGRSGDIPISLELFDSDSDSVTVTLEVTFNGTDFIPLTLSAPNAGTVSGNTVTGVPSSPGGSAFSVTWQSAVDLPIGVTSGVIRATVVDDDRATEVPNSLPNNTNGNPNDPPLPNLFIHGGQGSFDQGTLFLLSPSISLAGPPIVVKVQADLTDPFYAPTIDRRFQIEGENFGTDETLVTVLINNVSQSVVEADSNFLLCNPVFGTKTGLLQVIVNGLPSNTVPVLVPGSDFWTDTTTETDDDPIQLPSINDPSVHGEFHDLDGDGDLDIVVAQDGTNSILVNQNLNTELTSLLAGPYTISSSTNRFEFTVVRSAISRDAGPFNVSPADQLSVVTTKVSNGPNTPVSDTFTTSSAMTTPNQVIAGRTYASTTAGYVAALLNSSANNTGIGRTFNASVLNRRNIEIFPAVATDRLAVFEAAGAPFTNRQPLGFNSEYANGYGANGTDRLTVTTTGTLNAGDSLSNGLVQGTVFRIQPGANAGEFIVDVSVQPGFAVGQVVVNQVGVSATIIAQSRSRGSSMGGTTVGVTLPVGTLTPANLVTTLNDAAINAGLDVPGQIVKLRVSNGAALVPNTSVTTQGGFAGTVIQNQDNQLIRLRAQNTAVAIGDILVVNGAQVATVTAVVPTRNDFVARLSSNGLNVRLISNDVLVVGNANANQVLGFISTRIISTQSADSSGNYSFGPEFTDLSISLADGTGAGSQTVVIPLSGTMSVADVVTAINDNGLPALLTGNSAAGRFEASVVTSSTGEQFVEITTDDPSKSINILDRGAQRVLGFIGRFVKPHARGLGNYTDETAGRLPVQTAEFTTKIEVFDIDEDGDPDLLEVNSLAQNRIYINAGLGTFSDQTTTLLPAFQDESFGAVAVDLDNDGDKDLAIANRGRNRVLENRTGEIDPSTSQLFAPGTMTDRSFFAFPATIDAATTKISADVTAGDLDGDGRDDLVFANLTRTAGSGPFILFNVETVFPTQSSDPDKFTFASSVLSVPSNGTANADSFLTESNILFQPRSGNDQNFSVAIGDVDADGRLDISIANEAGGILTTNHSFAQTNRTCIVTLSNSALELNKDNLMVNTATQSSATVVEVARDFPVAGQSTLVLSDVPADFTAGTTITYNPMSLTRPVLATSPRTTIGRATVTFPVDAATPNIFSPGDFIELLNGAGASLTGPLQIFDVGPLAAGTRTFELGVDPPNGVVTIRQVPVEAVVVRTGVTIFASRTHRPQFDFQLAQGTLGFGRSVYDYPKNVVNGIFDKRGSDSSKDLVLVDENGRLRERTPTSPAGLIYGTGGNTFARIAIFANSEDRTNVPFELGNILFVTNDNFGFKRTAFSDVSIPFYTSPFSDHQDPRAHMVADTIESFGTAAGDIDNDGDIDILFLNGGGQANGAQNFIYSSNIEPGIKTALPGAYP